MLRYRLRYIFTIQKIMSSTMYGANKWDYFVNLIIISNIRWVYIYMLALCLFLRYHTHTHLKISLSYTLSISILFTYVNMVNLLIIFFFFKVNSMPNIGLELKIKRCMLHQLSQPSAPLLVILLLIISIFLCCLSKCLFLRSNTGMLKKIREH